MQHRMLRHAVPHERDRQTHRLRLTRVDGRVPQGAHVGDVGGEDEPVGAAADGGRLTVGGRERDDGEAAGEVDPSVFFRDLICDVSISGCRLFLLFREVFAQTERERKREAKWKKEERGKNSTGSRAHYASRRRTWRGC